MLLLLTWLACAPEGPPPGPTDPRPPAADGAFAPALASDGADAWLTWLEPADTGHRLRLSRWLLGTWGRPITLAEGDELVDVPPRIVHTTEGAVVVAYEVEGEGGVVGLAARSEDRGHTWQTETLPGLRQGRPYALGPNADLVWVAAHRELQVAPLGGLGSSEPVGLDRRAEDPVTRLCDCTAPAATGSGPDLLVAVRTRDALERHGVAVARRAGEGGWRAVGVYPDGWQVAGCSQAGPAIARSDEAVALAWYTGETRPELRLSFSLDGGRTFEHPLRLAPEALSASDTPRVALAPLPDRSVAAVWTATRGAQALLLARGFTAAGQATDVVILDTVAARRVVGEPRAVAVGEGLLVAWTEGPEAGDPGGLRTRWMSLDQLGPPSGQAARAGTGAVASPLPDRLPSLTGTLPDGTPYALQTSARPLLLTVVTSWCLPCQEPLERVDTPAGVLRVALVLDPPTEALLARLQAAGWQVLLTDPGAVRQALGSDQVPASYLFDGGGQLLWSTRAPLHPGDPTLQHALRTALRPAAGAPAIGSSGQPASGSAADQSRP